MLVKIIILFLGGMAVVAMIGNWLFPGALSKRLPGRGRGLSKPPTCPKCGRYIIGGGGCTGCKPPARKG